MSLSHSNFLFISNTKQPLFTLVNIQQLFACVNIHQQPLVYIQHQLLLMSNNNFLLTTLLTNHVSRNLFVIYLCTFYQQATNSTHFLATSPSTNFFHCNPATSFSPVLLLFLFSSLNFFLVRLAIFMPSLQGEPCRGSSHPNSRLFYYV